MTSKTKKAVKQAAAKKALATMKKNKKAPLKTLASSKSKKAAPAKKPATKPMKPVVKAKTPEKVAKPLTKAPPPAPAKKDLKAAPAPAKKDDKKAAPPPDKNAKKGVHDKVAMGKKADGPGRTGAVSGSAQAKPVQPIKVEPKIIETPQPEFIVRAPDQELFSSDEIEQFRQLLLSERGKILTKARRAREEGNIQIDRDDMFDEVDQASAMIDQNLTFRLLDRDRKLLTEIDHAIAKLDSGDFGYCEGTGEPIPKRRLELRPWCRHSVKYKEKLERMKKSGRGVVDEDEV